MHYKLIQKVYIYPLAMLEGFDHLPRMFTAEVHFDPVVLDDWKQGKSEVLEYYREQFRDLYEMMHGDRVRVEYDFEKK